MLISELEKLYREYLVKRETKKAIRKKKQEDEEYERNKEFNKLFKKLGLEELTKDQWSYVTEFTLGNYTVCIVDQISRILVNYYLTPATQLQIAMIEDLSIIESVDPTLARQIKSSSDHTRLYPETFKELECCLQTIINKT